MRQFLLPDQIRENSCITVQGKDYHYLRHVLRLKQGDAFQGIDRRGYTYRVKLSAVTKRTICLELISGTKIKALDCRVVLLQGLLKGRKMDTIVRMATEMGVQEVVPVISDYTVVTAKEVKYNKVKLQRWCKIAEQAVQQSGSGVVPKISEPVLLDHGLASWKKAKLCVFCHQEPIAVKSLHGLLAAAPAEISVLIGPEGGFSERELPLLMDKGFMPIYLGENILRAETAALYTLAAIKMILLEKKTWKLQPEQQKK
ncbi:MAG: 16S rRNA (uracil(1498)-N(3))-methyltransferase [Spirochaetales bacterium]|nr:16S rRNA (uracil(1498)-N(3))-methyltransferase [Spirochaetales bacterium]